MVWFFSGRVDVHVIYVCWGVLRGYFAWDNDSCYLFSSVDFYWEISFNNETVLFSVLSADVLTLSSASWKVSFSSVSVAIISR